MGDGGKEREIVRIECDIIRDLMPLYAEKMVSEKSGEAVEEHLRECEQCREIYEKMSAPAPRTQFQTRPQESFRKYVRKKKWGYGLKVALLTLAGVAAVLLLRFALTGGLIGLLALDGELAEAEVDTDINHYERYMGETAEEKYRGKLGVDDSIFPAQITADMQVLDYKMVYYDPWDRQYLSYLAVEYEGTRYDAELARLENCAQDAYAGYYGAQGFDPAYRVLAAEVDDSAYCGMVYALGAEDNRIIYVEILFCNYFMDLEYEEYIDTAYLPIGFNAVRGNPYREEYYTAVFGRRP